MLGSGTRLVVFGGAALLLAAPGIALAGRADPAPVAADVLQRLVPTHVQRPFSVPEVFEQHLDGAAAALERLEEENRAFRGRDGDAAPQTTARSVLASRLHQLRSARSELAREVTAMRGRTASAGPREREAWNREMAEVERRVDEAIKALEAVERGQTHGERRRATQAARGELGKLRAAARRERDAEATPPRTFAQRANLWHAPEPATAPAPRYMSFAPRRVQVAFNEQAQTDAEPLLLAQSSPPAEAQACGYDAADLAATPDAQLTQEIRDLAASLGGSPVKIYQWVSNEIAFQPYYGSLKGAAGTLSSRAGNATDQASLLIALLRASNIPARYVKGTIDLVDQRVLNWVGAKTHAAAAAILNAGLIPATPIKNSSNVITGVRLTHVWAQACVPYGNYRGTAIDRSGHRWVPLDASFKDKAYQAGIATSVNFDYASYLGTRSNVLPHEKYAEQIEAYIKAQPPAFANNTLEDVPYKGKLLPRTIDILPASLPYFVVGFNAWDTGLTAETASLPAKHRYTWNIEVRNSAGTLLAPSLTLNLPDVVQQRVTLSFQGATAGDQTAIANWRADPDVNAALPCTANVVPVVRVEGTNRAVGTTAVGICTSNNRLQLRLFLDEVTLGTQYGDANIANYSNIQASDYHALIAYAFQASDRLLADRAARLMASVRATADPHLNLEETEGEFLHLVGMKYMRATSDGMARVAELDGGSGQSGNHLGLTSSRMKVSYVFDRPFAIYRSGFLVDVPAGQNRNRDLATGAGMWKTFLLSGYVGSAYESWIWQENARLDAVSTVRGIQFAREKGIEVLTITAANQSSEIPKLTSNSNPALNYSPGQVSGIQNWIAQGFRVITPRSHIQYENWTGGVWMVEKDDSATTGEMAAGFMIDGGYAGGYSVITVRAQVWTELGPVMATVTYNPDTGTGYFYVYPWDMPRAPPRPDPFATYDPWATYGAAPGWEAFPWLNSMNNLGPATTTAGDPVNMVTGNMYHIERDLAIKGRGLPIVFERTYNSLGMQDGPLGFGWTHSFNHALVFNDSAADGTNTAVDGDGVTSSVMWVDGSGATRFIRVTGASAAGVPSGASFTPPQGFFFQAARQADGTYTIREKSGLTYTFENAAGTVGQRARLTRIADRNGNGLRMTYTGTVLSSVTDDLNRSLTLTYNANNRLIELRDWTGRRHEYGYDAAGNLTTYKNPLAVAGTQSPVTYAYYSDAPLAHFMQRYTLPRGNGMTFEYYANGRVFRHTNTLGESMSFSYNIFRREALSVNERGLARQYFFDPNGNLIRSIEEGSGERLYTFDPANPFNRVSARDPIGRVTGYAYDASGNVIRKTAPSGNTVETSFFNAFGQPGKMKDARGNYTILKYDAKGNLLESIRLRSGVGASVDPVAFVPAAADVIAWTVSAYDSFGNVLTSKQVRDASAQVGPTLELDYSDTVNMVQSLNAVGITRRGDKNGDGAIDAAEFDSATLAYDALGRTTTGLRRDWYATQSVYDAVDRVIRGTDAVGQLRDYTYDANGNVVGNSFTIGSTLWDQQTFSYDLSDRRITSVNAAGHVTQHEYDASGNLIAMTSADGHKVRFEYDANGRVIAAFDEEGHTSRRTLDLDGQPRTLTDANGNTVTLEYYDSTRDGRLKLQRDAVGRVTQFDYDAHGNVTVVTDNLGRTTLKSYDEQNRAVRVVGPAYTDATLGTVRPVTRYTYSLLGDLLSLSAGTTDATGTNPASDAVSTQMTYAWDDFGRKIAETDALGRSRRWTYDVQGNPLTTTDAKLQMTRFTWNYGHLIATRRDHASGQTTWTRNPRGQATQISSPGATYVMTHDVANRIATVRDTRGPTLTYRWSPGGRLTSYEDTHGNRTDYAYDAVGRLNGIWSPKGDLVSFIYDAGGRLTDKWFPNGVTTQYVWNADNTLARVVNSYQSRVLLSQHDYTYDAVGNRATYFEAVAPGTITSYTYLYDALNRLTDVRDTVTTATLARYTYDALGNRMTKTEFGGAVTAYTYDAANQLVEWRSVAAGHLLGAQVFDANGNVTKKCEAGTVTVTATDCMGSTITTLTYNALNQLSQAATTGLSAQSYFYDDEGRRVRKTIGATPTNYLYMGSDIVNQYGSSMAVAPTAVFTHGPNTDDPLIRATGTTSQYYHQDGLGSVVALSNADGALAANARYDAFGVKIDSFSAMPVYGYSGREPDETGLVYYRARYYDPALGRFTQRDPIGLAGGLNLYAYVGNNPINYTDPSGLMPAQPGATPPGYPVQLAQVPPIFQSTMIDVAPVVGGTSQTPGFQGLQQQRPQDSLLVTPATPSSCGCLGGFATGALNGLTEAIGKPAEFLNWLTGGLIFKEPQTPQEILVPGGQPIGQPGTSTGIRVLPGGTQAAQELFDQLSKGGTVTNNPRYPGTQVELPNNGGVVGIRPKSKSGDTAIDVNIPGLDGIVDKIHFP